MPHDLDSNLLRAFVTVVEAGSVSTAASRLARTQAAVSMALRRLEDDVGQRLLDRSPRGVQPTDAGRLLLPYAQRILGAAADARRILAGRQVEGAVRLGLIEDAAVGRLPHALRRFSSAYPQVSLEIAVDYSRALSAKLANGRLDLVIGDREAFASPSVLGWHRRLQWVGAKRLVLDLDTGVPLVAFENCCWQKAALSVLSAAQVPWRIVCTSMSLLAIQSAVEAGLGLAVLLDETIRSDSMRIVGQGEGLPALPAAEFGLYVAETPDPDPAVAALRAFLIEELAS